MFRSKRRFGRLSLLQYLPSNSVRTLYFYFLYSLLYYFRYFCMSRRGVINDYDNLISVTAWNICSCCRVEGNAFDTRQPAAEKKLLSPNIDSELSLRVNSNGFLVPYLFRHLLGFICSKIQGYKDLQIRKKSDPQNSYKFVCCCVYNRCEISHSSETAVWRASR